MKEIRFYTTATGRCPVQEHLDALPDKVAQKVAWVLRVVRDFDRRGEYRDAAHHLRVQVVPQARGFVPEGSGIVVPQS